MSNFTKIVVIMFALVLTACGVGGLSREKFPTDSAGYQDKQQDVRYICASDGITCWNLDNGQPFRNVGAGQLYARPTMATYPATPAYVDHYSAYIYDARRNDVERIAKTIRSENEKITDAKKSHADDWVDGISTDIVNFRPSFLVGIVLGVLGLLLFFAAWDIYVEYSWRIRNAFQYGLRSRFVNLLVKRFPHLVRDANAKLYREDTQTYRY